MKFTMYTGFSENVAEKGIEGAAEYAAGLGFSSVEFFVNANSGVLTSKILPDVGAAEHARKVLEQAGLSAACHSVFVDLYKQEENEKNLLQQAEIAGALGAPFLHHTLLPFYRTGENKPGYEEAIEKVVEVAGRVADYAATLGLTCIYEDQGGYVNGVEGFGGFWKKMKQRCKNVGICADLGNILYVGETPKPFLEAFAEDVCHVHVKDLLQKTTEVSPGRYWMRTMNGWWLRNTMVGSGVVDFEACLKILKKADYQGSFALENNHPEPYEDGVYQAMEYLRRYQI